ncbi:MAG TPA: hypothetical protein DCR62_02615 [Acholeplasmatales bacterium]|nr:hypothetical protein [Acholeplasmatales bacterium]
MKDLDEFMYDILAELLDVDARVIYLLEPKIYKEKDIFPFDYDDNYIVIFPLFDDLDENIIYEVYSLLGNKYSDFPFGITLCYTRVEIESVYNILLSRILLK